MPISQITNGVSSGVARSIINETVDFVNNLTKTTIGLADVDNTSDLNKPISTATQTALDTKSDTTHTHTKSDVGLGNVDNTSDLNKPISTATQTALNGKLVNPSVTTVTYGATITTDSSVITHESVVSISLTGDITINAPTNPANGKKFTYYLTASGGVRNLTLNAAIKTPTGVTFESAIVSGSSRVLELTYVASRWLVTKNLEVVA